MSDTLENPSADATAGPGPEAELLALTDLLTPMAVRVAATLRLGDQVAEARDPRGASVAGLARGLGVEEWVLSALVRYLAERDVFTVADGRVGLGRLGGALRAGPARDHLDLLRASGRMDRAWFGLLDAVTTGEPGYPRAFGTGFWADLAADPARAASFDDSMAASTDVWMPEAAAADVWPDEGEVVDVGGGTGRLLRAVLEARPGLRGALVELEATAGSARHLLRSLGERARVVAGSFFDPLPTGADTYVLAQVLHDWPDHPATAILRRCADAAGDRGEVLVIERLADEGHAEMDLLMLNLFGARRRSRDDYAALARAAGLALLDEAPVGHGLVALRLRPRRRPAARR